MSGMRFRSMGVRVVAAAVGAGAVLVTACGNSTNAEHVTRTHATFAEQPAGVPDYILPLASNQYFSAANLFQFQYLMYRPLYWFGTGRAGGAEPEPQPCRSARCTRRTGSR